jgi:hypothetical protein
MTDVDSWLERYEKSHQNLKNPVVFWAAVPMVVLGTVGVLWYLPIPEEFFEISPLLNWGSACSVSRPFNSGLLNRRGPSLASQWVCWFRARSDSGLGAADPAVSAQFCRITS